MRDVIIFELTTSFTTGIEINRAIFLEFPLMLRCASYMHKEMNLGCTFFWQSASLGRREKVPNILLIGKEPLKSKKNPQLFGTIKTSGNSVTFHIQGLDDMSGGCLLEVKTKFQTVSPKSSCGY